MITNDAGSILEEVTEAYKLQINEYFEKNRDNMTARNVLAQRKVGANVEIDVVMKYDRRGPGAQIVAKGGSPDKTGVTGTPTYFPLYQIAAGFSVNAKDMKIDGKIKNRNLEVAMGDIKRAEDNLAINGNSTYNITGIVGAARANTNGKIAASGGTYNNAGAWSGETGTDIYSVIKLAIDLMDDRYEPAFILGNKITTGKLDRMSSERIPYYMEIASLFGKSNPKDKSFIWTSAYVPTGYAYVVAKDMEAGEWVVSENPRVVPYAVAPGENYPFEILSWATPEIHCNEAFVEIAIT